VLKNSFEKNNLLEFEFEYMPKNAPGQSGARLGKFEMYYHEVTSG